MFQDASYEELRRREDVVWVDVRSPGEFAESSIPGAVNVPLFTDEERVLVGTAYKQVSPDKAKELGITIASPKIPQLIQEIRSLSRGSRPVIFCSRGGMRSKTVATLVDLAGEEVLRLDGGYRAYRAWVVNCLEQYRLQGRFVMLHGLTGVGKTYVLQELISMGEPAIDLEQIAGHRGSAFGGLGLQPQNQRMFDSNLIETLERVKEAPYVIMEAESKRIGRVQLPDFLLEGRGTAVHFLLEADIAIRVQRILSQYMVDSPDFEEIVRGALRSIEKRLQPADKGYLWEAVEKRSWPDFVARLLTAYYDPLYAYSVDKYSNSFIKVDATSIQQCALEIKQYLHAHVFAS